MRRSPKPEETAQIEALWRHLLSDADEAGLQRALEFEMATVSLHQKHMIPFVQGHGIPPGSRVLDFGSGPGCSAVALVLDLDVDVVGVEVNHDVRPIAELWLKAYEMEDRISLNFMDDTRKLPFEDGSFDYVLTNSCLEYIPGNRAPYIRELVRVLRPGGRLLVAGTSNAAWPREVHSGTWFLNWMPNLGAAIRRYRGANVAERGVTFGEILAASEELHYVPGTHDELDAFAARVGSKFGPANALMRRGLRATMARVNDTLEHTIEYPMEAFLPWLNVGFEKRTG